MRGSRRSRLAPGKRDRRRAGGGKPILASRPDRNSAATAIPPALRLGQVRCPVCRNGTTLTKTGRLRAHRDLFEMECGNRIPDGSPAVTLTELPPVVGLPLVAGTSASTRGRCPNGACHECDKVIPPGRLLCGRCMSRRHP